MRLCLKISDDMAEKIESFSKSFGMSKSAFMSYCIGSHIRTLESQESLINSVKTALNDKVKSDVAS